jgi:hypothetical protein
MALEDLVYLLPFGGPDGLYVEAGAATECATHAIFIRAGDAAAEKRALDLVDSVLKDKPIEVRESVKQSMPDSLTTMVSGRCPACDAESRKA